MIFGSRKPAAAPEKPATATNGQNNPTKNDVAAPAAPAKAPPPATAGATAAQAAGQPPQPAGPGAQISPDEAKRRAQVSVQLSVALAQIIAVLMRSPQHKHLSLADLEWLVFPPLMTGQFAVAEARAKDAVAGVPAALVLWASVSPEVDKKLAENPGAPIKLRPDEWKSGEILWLIEAVGDGRVVPQFLKELSEKAFKGKQVKIRTRGPDGKAMVGTLQANLAAEAKPPGRA